MIGGPEIRCVRVAGKFQAEEGYMAEVGGWGDERWCREERGDMAGSVRMEEVSGRVVISGRVERWMSVVTATVALQSWHACREPLKPTKAVIAEMSSSLSFFEPRSSETEAGRIRSACAHTTSTTSTTSMTSRASRARRGW